MSNTKYIHGTLNIATPLTNDDSLNQLLVRASDGTIKYKTDIPINNGNILYVASTGSDTDATRAGHLGLMGKPFLTLHAARTAAISGDIIYVFPQTFVFDNRTAAGLPYNNNQELINLYKAGVDYYFEDGCKIKLYNQTVTGQEIYLMRPSTAAFSTSNIYGLLEYEQYSEGADTSGGDCYLYNNGGDFSASVPTLEAVGNTCLIQTKSIKSFCNGIASINRDVTIVDKSILCKVTIVTGFYERSYVQGQTGAGGSIVGIQSSDASVEFNFYAKTIASNQTALVYLRTSALASPAVGNNTIVNIHADSAKSTFRQLIRLLSGFGGTVNWTVKESYFNSSNLSGAFVAEQNFGGILPFIVNINGNGSDYAALTDTNNVFSVVNANHIITMKGDLTLLNSSGVGRTIAKTSGASIIDIKGNINYAGVGVTTAPMFNSTGGGIIRFSGHVKGNFACPITRCFTGTITLCDGSIISTIPGALATVFENGGAVLGTVKMRNFYVELVNNTNPMSNGSYVKAIINNSKIVNAGSTDTLSNLTNFGLLQLEHSTIISTGISINYTGTASVRSDNSSTNTMWSVNNIGGDITLITDLIY